MVVGWLGPGYLEGLLDRLPKAIVQLRLLGASLAGKVKEAQAKLRFELTRSLDFEVGVTELF